MVTISILGFSYSFSQLFLANCFFGATIFIFAALSLYEYFLGDDLNIPFLLLLCFIALCGLISANDIVVITFEGC